MAKQSGRVDALRWPHCDVSALEFATRGMVPRGVDRAIIRWQQRLSQFVWEDAALEGNTFTLPDVTTVLDGASVDGYSEFQVNQVRDLGATLRYAIDCAQQGIVEPSEALSSELNRLITAHEIIEPGILRGEGKVTGGGHVSAMGTQFNAIPTGPDVRAVFTESLERVAAMSHPVARGAMWAALGAYHQFYGNGNKRTARYVMNTVLVSHGYDAILTPFSQQIPYNAALKTMYTTGDLTPFALYTISLYNDSHESPTDDPALQRQLSDAAKRPLWDAGLPPVTAIRSSGSGPEAVRHTRRVEGLGRGLSR